MPNPPHLPRLLRLSGERRGEETAGQGAEERAPVHSRALRLAALLQRCGQRVDLTPAGRACGLRFGSGLRLTPDCPGSGPRSKEPEWATARGLVLPTRAN